MAQGSESNYRLFPSFIASTRSVLNPKNRDLRSFGHAIIFSLNPTDWNSHRGQSAKNSRFIHNKLNLLKYPVLLNEISKLENKLQLKINIFSFDDAPGYKRYSL